MPTTATHQSAPITHVSHRTTSLRPLYFISRGNNCYVPLVATDELPSELHLQGAPRWMSPESAVNMNFLGEYPRPSTTYKLSPLPVPQSTALATHYSLHSPTPYEQYKAPDTGMRVLPPSQIDALPPSADAMSLGYGALSPSSSIPEWRRSNPLPAAHNTQSLIDALAAHNPEAALRHKYKRVPTPPSGVKPDETKKTHCTHWMRTGECDYVQKGCMYKHEMPEEFELHKFGFKTFPRWWKDQMKPTLKPHPQKPTGPTWLQRKTEKAARGEDSDDDQEEAGRAVTFLSKPSILKSTKLESVNLETARTAPVILTPKQTLQPKSKPAVISTTNRNLAEALDLIDLEDRTRLCALPILSPDSSTSDSGSTATAPSESDSSPPSTPPKTTVLPSFRQGRFVPARQSLPASPGPVKDIAKVVPKAEKVIKEEGSAEEEAWKIYEHKWADVGMQLYPTPYAPERKVTPVTTPNKMLQKQDEQEHKKEEKYMDPKAISEALAARTLRIDQLDQEQFRQLTTLYIHSFGAALPSGSFTANPRSETKETNKGRKTTALDPAAVSTFTGMPGLSGSKYADAKASSSPKTDALESKCRPTGEGSTAKEAWTERQRHLLMTARETDKKKDKSRKVGGIADRKPRQRIAIVHKPVPIEPLE